MTVTPRWGITLPLRSMPLDGQRDIVAGLPDLGYTDAWSSELNGADAFTPLALVAQWTDLHRAAGEPTWPPTPTARRVRLVLEDEALSLLAARLHGVAARTRSAARSHTNVFDEMGLERRHRRARTALRDRGQHVQALRLRHRHSSEHRRLRADRDRPPPSCRRYRANRAARAPARARADRQEDAAQRARRKIQRLSRLRGRDHFRPSGRGRVSSTGWARVTPEWCRQGRRAREVPPRASGHAL